MTRADRISDAIVKDSRTLTLTGRIIGIVTRHTGHVDITLRVNADDDITVHKAD